MPNRSVAALGDEASYDHALMAILRGQSPRFSRLDQGHLFRSKPSEPARTRSRQPSQSDSFERAIHKTCAPSPIGFVRSGESVPSPYPRPSLTPRRDLSCVYARIRRQDSLAPKLEALSPSRQVCSDTSLHYGKPVMSFTPMISAPYVDSCPGPRAVDKRRDSTALLEKARGLLQQLLVAVERGHLG